MTLERGRAYGKVILLGEHAVVYGVPAVAMAVDRGARASAEEAPVPKLTVGTTEVPDDAEVSRALRALLTRLGSPPMHVQIDLDVPPGCGLGASAAMGVATARAVCAALGREEKDAELLDAVDGWERVFHGNPSGVDAAAAVAGGCLHYVRGEEPRPLTPGLPLRVAIAVAGPPASTKLMVDGVARLKQRRPELVQKTLDGIRSLVRNAILAIEAGDRDGLGKLMDYNQMLLSGLMVSTEGIERACHAARAAGALGAKLTGAGGGGCVVALVEGDPTPVIAAWRKEGFECFATQMGAAKERSTS